MILIDNLNPESDHLISNKHKCTGVYGMSIIYTTTFSIKQGKVHILNSTDNDWTIKLLPNPDRRTEEMEKDLAVSLNGITKLISMYCLIIFTTTLRYFTIRCLNGKHQYRRTLRHHI